MIAEEAVKELLQSPQLPRHVAQLESVWQAEQARRARFYDEITESQKVEFINGEVVVQSPAKLIHTIASLNLATLLSTYVQKHQLGHVGNEKLLVSLSRNDYEPDICFFGPEKAAEFTPDQMTFLAPDMVVEVLSPSTERIDRGVKFEDYAAHGVAEYWLVDPDQQLVEQYLLPDQRYTLHLKIKDGPLHSTVITGFTIPVKAIFEQTTYLAALKAFLNV
jgi:Uma2 family endonuclease